MNLLKARALCLAFGDRFRAKLYAPCLIHTAYFVHRMKGIVQIRSTQDPVCRAQGTLGHPFPHQYNTSLKIGNTTSIWAAVLAWRAPRFHPRAHKHMVHNIKCGVSPCGYEQKESLHIAFSNNPMLDDLWSIRFSLSQLVCAEVDSLNSKLFMLI